MTRPMQRNLNFILILAGLLTLIACLPIASFSQPAAVNFDLMLDKGVSNFPPVPRALSESGNFEPAVLHNAVPPAVIAIPEDAVPAQNK